jgi:hypothetical protein
VGVAYRTTDGIADFHAAGRHTCITELLRNCVTLPEAKQLARHSDINMTMRYTHIGMDDKSKAAAKLPAPVAPPPSGKMCSAVSDCALQMHCFRDGILVNLWHRMAQATWERNDKTLAMARVLSRIDASCH